MDFLINWLAARDHWDWFILALVLLICELFGAGLYFFWIGIAAGIVGALHYVFPTMGWQMQLILFSVFSVATTYFWLRIQNKNRGNVDEPNLNERMNSFVGKTFPLKDAILDGQGYIKVDDSMWVVKGDDLPARTKIRVVGYEDSVLLVEKVD